MLLKSTRAVDHIPQWVLRIFSGFQGYFKELQRVQEVRRVSARGVSVFLKVDLELFHGVPGVA